MQRHWPDEKKVAELAHPRARQSAVPEGAMSWDIKHLRREVDNAKNAHRVNK